MESWEWPDGLDALVAAPDHHTLLFENDDVRVLDARVPSGEVVPVHTHRWPGVLYIIRTGHFVRRNPDGEVLVDSRASGIVLHPGTAVWTPAVPPHTLENADTAEIHMIAVELKQ